MSWWKHGKKNREAPGCAHTWLSEKTPEKCPKCNGTKDIWQIGTR